MSENNCPLCRQLVTHFHATEPPLDTWGRCPRCQQLAALEAEIGRAVLGFNIVHTTMQDGQDPLLLTAYGSLNTEESALIARWRKLHAEGAEAEAATERQEGK